MTTLIAGIAGILIGFVAGILVGRANPKKTEKVIRKAKKKYENYKKRTG